MFDSHPASLDPKAFSRRQFVGGASSLLGTAAFAKLAAESQAAQNPQSPLNIPHFAPRAKRVIYLFFAGGPSHIDLFDYKPTLKDIDGQPLPESVRKGQRLTTMTSKQKEFLCVAPRFNFNRCGQRGTWVNTDLLPNLAKVADDFTVIRSMHTEAINHDSAITYINTGSQQHGRPSFGSWISYGLGSSNNNLPSYVVMISVGWAAGQALYTRLWGSGCLPSRHQGVQFRSVGDPVLYLSDPPGLDRDLRRRMLDGLATLNEDKLERTGDPEIEARIAQYEMAFRMQMSVPGLMDTEDEPESTFKLYGEDAKKKGTFASNCLLARRMAERGVPFIQLFHRGWDQHGTLPTDIKKNTDSSDQPAAALLTDLKQRGMLDDTVVIIGGEFGRTIYCQGDLTKKTYGRDHHGRCFSTVVAGGGLKTGIDFGESDDHCYSPIQDPVHINDLNATVLHCLGINHRDFSVKHQGLDVRLTGVDGARVIPGLLA